MKVRVYGNTGAIVPAAFMLVGNGKEFYVDVDYTVGGEGYADCYANCTEPGTGGNLTVGTEITIVNPDPIWNERSFWQLIHMERSRNRYRFENPL